MTCRVASITTCFDDVSVAALVVVVAVALSTLIEVIIIVDVVVSEAEVEFEFDDVVVVVVDAVDGAVDDEDAFVVGDESGDNDVGDVALDDVIVAPPPTPSNAGTIDSCSS